MFLETHLFSVAMVVRQSFKANKNTVNICHNSVVNSRLNLQLEI